MNENTVIMKEDKTKNRLKEGETMLKTIYPYLVGQMAVRDITVRDIAACIGRNEDTTRKKIAGTTAFDINEAIKINECLFADIPFKKLWEQALQSKKDNMSIS